MKPNLIHNVLLAICLAASIQFSTGQSLQAEELNPADRRALAQANSYFERGNEFVKKGSLARARGEYQKAVKIFPRHLDAIYNLAVVCEQLGEHDEAVAAYQKYLEQAPNDPDVWTQLGVIHDLAGRPDEARKVYEKALALDPKFGRAHHNLGVLLKQSGQIDKAREHLQQFVKLQEEAKQPSADGYYSLGLLELEQARFTEAKRMMGKALEINPGNALYHNAMGDIYLAEKEYDQALLHFQTAIDRDAKFALAYSGLGDALRGQEKTKEAIDAYSKALELRPDYGVVHYKLGRLYADAGDAAAATKHFEKYLESGKKLAFRDEVVAELAKLKSSSPSTNH